MPDTTESVPWLFRETDNLATLIGYVLALVASFLALRQWNTEQRWKRRGALMERIFAFGETPGARNAMLMMFSSDRDVLLWDADRPEDRYVRVTRKEVMVALLPPDILPYTADSKENAIRDSFDDFFGRLAHVNLFLDEKLMTVEDARFVALPWVEVIAGASGDPPFQRRLKLFIEARDMVNVKALMETLMEGSTSDLGEVMEVVRAEVERDGVVRPKPPEPTPQATSSEFS